MKKDGVGVKGKDVGQGFYEDQETFLNNRSLSTVSHKPGSAMNVHENRGRSFLSPSSPL